MIVVPDASVILKWVLERDEGKDLPRAVDLQRAFLSEAIDIRVPALWRYEVGNVLGLKQPALASELMNALLDFEFQEVQLTGADCHAVLQLMREIKGVTFYDSCYHVVALQADGVYVTADRAYVKRAGRLGHVSLLSDWRLPRHR